jgi:6-pyruvoyl-tetrahydropterin synthase
MSSKRLLKNTVSGGPKGPSCFRLNVFHQFTASHSLEGFLAPHYHLWKVSVEFEVPFPLRGDRVVDLVLAEEKLIRATRALEGSHLNETLGVSPTSENLCVWIWSRFEALLPEPEISAVSVTLCDLEGKPTGRAELRR